MNTDSIDKQFLAEVDDILDGISILAEKYGVSEKLAMACYVSVVNNSEASENEAIYSTVTSLMIADDMELATILGHIHEIYKNRNGYDFDDLFDNINLN